MTENINACSEGRNELNRAEEYYPFSATEGSLEKGIHPELVRALRENDISCSNVTRFCRKPISGLDSKEASSSSNDDGFDELSEVFLMALPDKLFLLCSRSLARYALQKAPDIVGLSILCISESGIFIWFLTNFPTLRRQVE
jgi:hypothetical protein